MIETNLKVIFTNFNFYQISRKGRKRILLSSVGDNGEYRNITIYQGSRRRCGRRSRMSLKALF